MSQEPEDVEKTIAKSLRLRGASVPVARVSRKALVIVGAVLITGVAGAVSWSLIQKRREAPVDAEFSQVAPPETVTSQPRGYVGPASVPVLGPPLPGDLGRPILAAARARAGEGTVADAAFPTPIATQNLGKIAEPDPLVLALRETRRAAVVSGLFVSASARRETPGSEFGAASPADAAGAKPDQDPRTTSVERLQGPASPYILQAGAVIPGALVTGLRSDAPGLAIALVTQDVFDSLGGGVLLIPAGARLVGDYEAEIHAGQSRLRVAWTRLILPSGRSIVLDKLPAADAQGMAGLQDGVDRHGRRVLAAAGLSTLLAIGAEAGGDSDEDALVRALRRGGADAASQVGQQIVGRSLDLAPTLTIRPGAPLRVILTRDLVLEPYRERSAP